MRGFCVIKGSVNNTKKITPCPVRHLPTGKDLEGRPISDNIRLATKNPGEDKWGKSEEKKVTTSRLANGLSSRDSLSRKHSEKRLEKKNMEGATSGVQMFQRPEGGIILKVSLGYSNEVTAES